MPLPQPRSSGARLARSSTDVPEPFVGKRIACLDCLEVLLSPYRNLFIFLVHEKSPLREIIEANVAPDQIVHIQLMDPTLGANSTEKDLLLKSDFFTYAKELKITHLLLNASSSFEIERKASEVGISLISVSILLQESFENKNHFQHFLEQWQLPSPLGKNVHAETDIHDHRLYPGVLQTPHSVGSLGTYFVDTSDEAEHVIQTNKLSLPLLLRKFEEGSPLGVTVLCGGENIIFSACRIQCAVTLSAAERPFCGIQWVPYTFFSSDEVAQIEELLRRTAHALMNAGFRGIANIDFLLGQRGPLILECNPRLSGATWSLARHTELLHGEDFLTQYINTLCNGEPTRHEPTLPKSTYEGASFDFDWRLVGAEGTQIVRMGRIDPGIYSWGQEGLSSVSRDLSDLQSPGKFMFYPFARSGGILNIKNGAGIAVSDWPLYDVDEREPIAHAEARVIRDYLAENVL
jgi:ATP-grasp domain